MLRKRHYRHRSILPLSFSALISILQVLSVRLFLYTAALYFYTYTSYSYSYKYYFLLYSSLYYCFTSLFPYSCMQALLSYPWTFISSIPTQFLFSSIFSYSNLYFLFHLYSPIPLGKHYFYSTILVCVVPWITIIIEVSQRNHSIVQWFLTQIKTLRITGIVSCL